MAIKSICIVGLDAYSVLAAKSVVPYIGGESVQHVLLARAWRDLGLDVTLIVHDEGQPREQVVDGIRTISTYVRGSGLRGLRFFHPHTSTLLSALARTDADVYYQSPASIDTGFTAWHARRRGKRFVFRLASDRDCTHDRRTGITWARDRLLYRYGLRRADLIAAQTVHQQRLLKQNYGLDSTVVSMAADQAPLVPPERKDIDVLWVSNFRPVKRPEKVLEVARALPQLQFHMVGGELPGYEELYAQVTREARALANVTVHGAVPYQEVGKLYDRARVFLNTSAIEGFPNSFLQAWMRGVPVVSTFDPDGLINRERLGTAVKTVPELVAPVRELLARPATLAETGTRAHDFAMKHFSGAGVARRYLELLEHGG